MCVRACACITCEATSLCQKEGAPGHEEEQSRLQQLKVLQLGELGHVTRESQGQSNGTHVVLKQTLFTFPHPIPLLE